MSKARFFVEVTVIDPKSNLPVEVSMFKHQNGGIFGIDSSYITSVLCEEGTPSINDPLEPNDIVILKDI